MVPSRGSIIQQNSESCVIRSLSSDKIECLGKYFCILLIIYFSDSKSAWVSRSISLDFIVPVQSAAELTPVYKKLENLAKLTYPIYASSGFTGTYVKTTIGDFYFWIGM